SDLKAELVLGAVTVAPLERLPRLRTESQCACSRVSLRPMAALNGFEPCAALAHSVHPSIEEPRKGQRPKGVYSPRGMRPGIAGIDERAPRITTPGATIATGSGCRAWQRDPRVGARRFLIRDVSRSAVRLGNRPDDRESEAGPASTACRVGPGEPIECPSDEIAPESVAVIAHVKFDAPVGGAGAETNLVAAVAERVVDEIAEGLFEPESVSRQPQTRCRRRCDALSELLGAPVEPTRHGGEQRVDVDLLAAER